MLKAINNTQAARAAQTARDWDVNCVSACSGIKWDLPPIPSVASISICHQMFRQNVWRTPPGKKKRNKNKNKIKKRTSRDIFWMAVFAFD